jgi:hypothetical protein
MHSSTKYQSTNDIEVSSKIDEVNESEDEEESPKPAILRLAYTPPQLFINSPCIQFTPYNMIASIDVPNSRSIPRSSSPTAYSKRNVTSSR